MPIGTNTFCTNLQEQVRKYISFHEQVVVSEVLRTFNRKFPMKDKIEKVI